jgi:Integrase core domain
MSCLKCQLRRRKTYLDRTPIRAIKRASFAFQHWFVDTFQLSANLPLKFNHCLVCVDSFSRWPAAFPLRKVTAKAVCDCLIQLFSYTNLPTTISSDNASTFCSELNREFLQRFGISPLFITPTHASANGLSERMVQSQKNMICKMAVDHKNRWPSVLTMALWALLEIPCETTG